MYAGCYTVFSLHGRANILKGTVPLGLLIVPFVVWSESRIALWECAL